MPLVLKQFTIGPMQNFGYLIGDAATKQAIVVDPAWSVPDIKRAAAEAGMTIAGLAVTHAHYDHTNAVASLLEGLDVPVYAHADEVAYARSGNSIVGDLGRTVRTVEGSEKIRLGETEIEFLHTPGHTPGSLCLRVEDHLITGDTLFIGGCGRSDLPGGNTALLFRTLQRIARLPGHLEVCPGHDYGDAPRRLLSEEIRLNPYLRLKDEEAFIDAAG